MLERRTKLAEEKIARAEAQAIADVRSIAVDTSIAAAERMLREKVSGAAIASSSSAPLRAGLVTRRRPPGRLVPPPRAPRGRPGVPAQGSNDSERHATRGQRSLGDPRELFG